MATCKNFKQHQQYLAHAKSHFFVFSFYLVSMVRYDMVWYGVWKILMNVPRKPIADLAHLHQTTTLSPPSHWSTSIDNSTHSRLLHSAPTQPLVWTHWGHYFGRTCNRRQWMTRTCLEMCGPGNYIADNEDYHTHWKRITYTYF